MEIIIILLVLCLGMSCSVDKVNVQNQQPDKVDLVVGTNEIIKMKDSFDIILQMDKLNDEHYSLSASIEMDSGSYVISPFSQDDFYLPFTININDNNELVVQGDLSETPISIEELDPYLNMPVRFVRENTTFTQNFKIVSKDDFEVTGLIEFLLEPSCVPYDVEFTISSSNGELEIEKTKTFISKEYRL